MGRGGRIYAAIFAAAYLLAAALLWANGPAKALGINDYISDEVWYVSAAVNVARHVLGLHLVPRTANGTLVYTVFYNSTACSLAEAEAAAEAAVPGLHVLNKTYEKAKAFAVEAPPSALGDIARLPLAARHCITDVMPGVAPDSEAINTYLNTEHPPLVKYILAAVIYAEGWNPTAWRLPSLAAALLGLGAATYAAYRLFTLQRRRSLAVAALAAAVIPAAAARDPALSSMATVAMLDIYAASLDALALALLLARRHRAASIALGLAGSAKYTGLFPAPLLALAVRLDTGSTRKAVALGIAVPLLVVAATWLPFAAAKGPAWVLNEVASSLAWHTTSRPPGPPSTTPLGLLLGRDGFVLYYTKDGKPLLAAVCNPGVCAAGAAIGAAAAGAALAARCRRLWGEKHLALLAAGGSPLTAWLGYVAVYAAGNHTLYSFYSVQISMLSIPSLASIPLLVEEADKLKPRPAATCLLTRWAPYASAAAAAIGVAAAAALAGGWPRLPTWPVFDPLASGLDPSSKLSRLGLAASALAVYTAAAARTTERQRSPRQGAALAARWLLAGLLSYTAPSAPLAPVLYLATSRPGFFESLLAGLSGPGPAGLLAAAHQRGWRSRAAYAAGYTLGYLAALAVLAASRPLPVAAPLPAVAATAAAMGAAVAAYTAPRGSLLLSYSLAALFDPSAAPLLALAPGGGAAALLALAASAGGRLYVAAVAAGAAVAASAGLLAGQGGYTRK